MAVTFYPSTLKGTPVNATDDHQSVSSFGIRCTARSADVIVGSLRWYAQGITVGATVRPFVARRDSNTIVVTGPSVVCVAGWNNLPLDSPVTLTSAQELFFAVEQPGSAKYTYTSNVDLDLDGTDPIKCLSGWGVWSYNDAAGSVAIWNAGAGNNTGNWYGVDIVEGVASTLSVVADHFPATGAVGATIGLSATPSGASGAVGYQWVQTAGPAATLSGATTANASFTPSMAGTFVFSVTATDSVGSANSSTTVSITAAPDVTPPAVPSALAASAITKSGATITWAPSFDAVGYRVYIGGVLYGTSTTPDKVIVGRSPDADMFVTVSAVDLAGNWSAQSPALLVHTLAASTPPPAGGAGTLWVKLDSGTWVATGAGSDDPDWLFRPESYGAKGDGLFLGGDVHTTNGSAIVTCASASFTDDDIGKKIIVTDAGPTGTRLSGSLIGTIVTVNSEHSITVSANAVKTQSDASAAYGTDDSQAFLDMMLAVKDYHLTARNPHVKVELDRVCYVLGTKPANDSDGLIGTWSRAQVPLPVNPSQQKRKWVTEIVGKGGLDGATFTSWHQTEPQFSGAMLFSMIEVTNADYIPEMPISVIGGVPGWPDDWQGQPNSFNNTLVKVDGVRVMCPHNPGQIAIDFNHEGQYHLGTVSADIFAAPHGLTGGYMIPQNPDGMGFRTNYTGYNDRNTAACLLIQGYYVGATVDEHCSWADCRIIYSKYGLFMNLPGGNTTQHGAWLGYASVEISDYPLFVATTDAIFGLSIDMLDNEGPALEHIHDPDGVLFGTVNVFPSGSTIGPVDAIVNGAANLTIHNLAGGTIIHV